MLFFWPERYWIKSVFTLKVWNDLTLKRNDLTWNDLTTDRERYRNTVTNLLLPNTVSQKYETQHGPDDQWSYRTWIELKLNFRNTAWKKAQYRKTGITPKHALAESHSTLFHIQYPAKKKDKNAKSQNLRQNRTFALQMIKSVRHFTFSSAAMHCGTFQIARSPGKQSLSFSSPTWLVSKSWSVVFYPIHLWLSGQFSLNKMK